MHALHDAAVGFDNILHRRVARYAKGLVGIGRDALAACSAGGKGCALRPPVWCGRIKICLQILGVDMALLLAQ